MHLPMRKLIHCERDAGIIRKSYAEHPFHFELLPPGPDQYGRFSALEPC